MKIKKVVFNAGPDETTTNFGIDISQITIVVGSNNSGKSLTLMDIEQLAKRDSNITRETMVVSSIEFDRPEHSEALELLKTFEVSLPNSPTSRRYFQSFSPGSSPGRFLQIQIEDSEFRKFEEGGDSAVERLYRHLEKMCIIRLDGRTRFNYVTEQESKNLSERPDTYLQALYINDDSREKIRELTEKAFNRYFIIDPTPMNRLRIKLSSEKPPENLEKLLTDEAIKFQRRATPIDGFGDGIKCFIGLLAPLLCSENINFLIDEPEAFLHPPLAHFLGVELTKIALERAGSLVVSTHSPDFVMGCIETSDKVTIIRLTFDDGFASTKYLPEDQVSKLMRDPLLRSTDALNALFHKSVIVCEADSDRVFYRDINYRLSTVERGIDDVLIMNVHSKDEIHRLVRPLREIGIPTIALVDLDVLKTEPVTFKILLSACNIQEPEKTEIHSLRKKVNRYLEKNGYASGGIYNLEGDEKEAALELLTRLNNYGFFIVPNGALESWLPRLSIQGHGNKWIINYFNELRTMNEADSDLLPGDDDVWGFIDEIHQWIVNRNRKGMF